MWFLRRSIFMTALLLISNNITAVPAYHGMVEVYLQDGEKVKVRLKGNERRSWHEDSKGRRVKKNSNGVWEYVTESDNRGYVPSTTEVGEEAPPENVAKSDEVERTVSLETKDNSYIHPALNVSGQRNILVILVNFPNLVNSELSTVQHIDRIFNETGYRDYESKGSVNDYFNEISYGKLNLTSHVTEWVTVSNNYQYYGKNDPVSNFDSNPRQMVEEALGIIESRGFDFSSVDLNNDRIIDGLVVIHAGLGEEYPNNDSDLIWSHSWQLSKPKFFDGVEVERYITVSELMGMTDIPETKSIIRIGVVCHELGHLLGLMDLYDIDNSSSGVGNFCLMGTGLWNSSGKYLANQPAHPSAWCKIRLGWVVPQTIDADNSYVLPQAETDNSIYKLKVPNIFSEYFLIENRQPHGFDEALPGDIQGALIWHVDTTVPDNRDEGHLYVDLVEASPIQHLQLNLSKGDDGDYFRKDTQSSFSLFTLPSNKTYQNEFLSMDIYDISDSQKEMNFSTRLYTGLDIEGSDEVDELSETVFKGMANFSSGSVADVSDKLVWETDSNEAEVTSSGVVKTQQVYNNSCFNLFASFNQTVGKCIKIKDITLGLEKMSEMLEETPLIQEEFYEFVSPQVENMSLHLISEYQVEFSRNLAYVEGRADWFQKIIDEVNSGNNIVISHVRSGWNMISTPFERWCPDLISSDLDSRDIFEYDLNTFNYQAQFSTFDLKIGKGYWIYYDDSEIAEDQKLEYCMVGKLLESRDFEITVGWNLIGDISGNRKVTPDSPAFIWDSIIENYHKLQDNEPLALGKGYWVFSLD